MSWMSTAVAVLRRLIRLDVLAELKDTKLALDEMRRERDVAIHEADSQRFMIRVQAREELARLEERNRELTSEAETARSVHDSLRAEISDLHKQLSELEEELEQKRWGLRLMRRDRDDAEFALYVALAELDELELS